MFTPTTPHRPVHRGTLALAAVLSTACLLSTTSSPAHAEPATGRATHSHTHSHTRSHARAALHATLQSDANTLLTYGAPGVQVGVQTDRGDLLVRAGVGDRATGAPVPWNGRFRVGSLTKTFVATTLLQLVGEGRLSLDDTVDRWLPGLVDTPPYDGRTITVRQLLQHTSGLPDYVAGMLYILDEQGFLAHRFDSVSLEDEVATAMTLPPDAPHGTWSYSNTNYALVGLIIEAVTGHSWQDEVRHRVVDRLGLTGTVLPGDSPDIPGPHAHGYERFPGPDATDTDPDYGDFVDVTEQNASWGGAAGEVISTPHDVNTFLRALVRGDLLPPAELAAMQTTVPTDPEFQQNWPGSAYGLGLMRIRTSCGIAWAHGGDIQGYQTRNAVSPDGSRSVTVSLNTDSLKPDPGVTPPTEDVTTQLIDDALCS